MKFFSFYAVQKMILWGGGGGGIAMIQSRKSTNKMFLFFWAFCHIGWNCDFSSN